MEKKLFQIKEEKKEKKYKKRFFFKKKNKIKKFKNIKKIKKYKFIIIKYNKNRLNYPRLGIIINKKIIKYSTIRNKIKRIIRETFRIKQYKIKKIDYLIILKKNFFKNIKNMKNYFLKIWKLNYI